MSKTFMIMHKAKEIINQKLIKLSSVYPGQ